MCQYKEGRMKKIGDRVGAILRADKDTVHFFGYGVYVGDEIPHERAVGFLAVAGREAGITNPKILLDDGKDVFGCECWWGSEQEVKEAIGDRKIVYVDIDQLRDSKGGKDVV